MGGGFLIARDSALFERASGALVEIGATLSVLSSEHMVQFADDRGRLFTMYEEVPVGTEWEVTDGPFCAAGDVTIPDMGLVTACPWECRWSDLVAMLCAVVARTAEAPTWLLDGDGVVWDAGAIDPTQLRL